MCSHRVQFYDSDAFLLRTVLDFVEPSRQTGDSLLVIATPAHLGALQAALGWGAAALQADRRDHCVFLDADETLATFMVDGMPDAQRFTDVIGGLVRQLSDNGQRRVSAFGEMVAVLYAQDKAAAAVCLEQLWETLAQQHRLDLLCAYPLSAFPDDAHRQAFECICAVHSHVNLIEQIDPASERDQLHRSIALLQQRANSLESELRRRHDFEGALASQYTRIAMLTSAQAELESLAGQDALTGLANRRIFTDRLAHAIERAARTDSPLALIYIDLDEFKALNDNHGHDAGDELLQQVAARLKLCVRTADTVCRWGGDEFAVIAEAADAAQAGVLVQRIVVALAEPFVLRDASSIDVSASVGLAQYPGDAADAQALLHNADADMYRAKRAAKAGSVETPTRPARLDATADEPAREVPRGKVNGASNGNGNGEGNEGTGDVGMLTVEAVAGKLRLSRPHVLKLIAEQRFNHVVSQHGGTPLIPLHEVTRVELEIRG